MEIYAEVGVLWGRAKQRQPPGLRVSNGRQAEGAGAHVRYRGKILEAW